jgi:hypothetical protein
MGLQFGLPCHAEMKPGRKNDSTETFDSRSVQFPDYVTGN